MRALCASHGAATHTEVSLTDFGEKGYLVPSAPSKKRSEKGSNAAAIERRTERQQNRRRRSDPHRNVPPQRGAVALGQVNQTAFGDSAKTRATRKQTFNS